MINQTWAVKWLARLLAAVGVVALLSVAVFGIIGVRHSLTAEMHLHAMRNVISGVDAYVKHYQQWPRSWEDFEPLYPRKLDWSASALS